MNLRAHRVLVVPVGLAVAALSLSTVSGQAPRARDGNATGWTMPRTIDGHPDLQGYWTNDTVTPLERPAEFGDKQFVTAAEAAAYAKKRMDQFLAQPADDIHYDDAIWQAENYNKQTTLRTSLVVDPSNGRLPPLTPEGQARSAERAKRGGAGGPSDSAQSRTLAERCISWGNVGPPMIPPTYYANMQILQSNDHVVLRHELMHDVRLIRLDASPRVNPAVQWMSGDARGRWEGDTFVVETSNFTKETPFRGPPRTTRQDITTSPQLRVTERFTLVDRDTIKYEFTVNDPGTWTQPWSGEIPMRRIDGPIYEYGCHEGNYGLENILRAARVQEANAR
jgi:hypothetical protein